MQSAESAHGGLQKVTAFKKVQGSIVKILVCSSFVWYIWLRAKNCLKWGKIYIALEMLFAGGGGGLGYRIQDASEHDAFLPGVLSFSFFFSRNPSLQELFLHSQIMKVGNVQSSFQNNIYKSGFSFTQTFYYF